MLDNCRHGLNGMSWPYANAGLSREHQRVGSVEDSICYVAHLGSGRSAFGDHRVQHLGRNDHRLTSLPAHLDGPLLHKWNHFKREFDSQIPTSHHYSVKRGNNVFEVVNCLRFFHFGEDWDSNPFFVHDRMHVVDVGRGSHKRQCN